MAEYIWLMRRVHRFEGAGAFLASLAVHGLLLILLVSTSEYLPVTRNAANIELWLSSSLPTKAHGGHSLLSKNLDHENYAAMQLGVEPDQTVPSQSTVFVTAGAVVATQPVDGLYDEAMPVYLVAAKVPDNKNLVLPARLPMLKDATVIKSKKRSDESVDGDGEATAKKSAVALPQQTEESQRESILSSESAAPLSLDQRSDKHSAVQTEGAISDMLQKQVKSPTALEPAQAEIANHSGIEQSIPPAAHKEPANKHAATLRHYTADIQAAAQTLAAFAPGSKLPPSMTIKVEGGARPTKMPNRHTSMVVAANPPRDVEYLAEQTEQKLPSTLLSQKPSESKGLVIPVVHGDLKLIVVGGDEVKLTFLLREYPKSRRNRRLTRTEARRMQKLTPTIVKTTEQTTQAVIETATEGVYILIAETEAGYPTEADFTIEFFEVSAKRRIKSLGTKNVSGSVVIAKVLMPEGILWDDESAFTGSMLDSDSTTKFNAGTGLIWKEYDRPIASPGH